MNVTAITAREARMHPAPQSDASRRALAAARPKESHHRKAGTA